MFVANSTVPGDDRVSVSPPSCQALLSGAGGLPSGESRRDKIRCELDRPPARPPVQVVGVDSRPTLGLAPTRTLGLAIGVVGLAA